MDQDGVPSIDDYRYCLTCEEGFDFWQYGDLKSAGHDGHQLREPTETEYKSLLIECKEMGCY